MSRIISGRFGGLRLQSPKHDIRPTADQVKEYMFNVCRDFDESVVADLYSGTGALGLEALSRGAEEVHFVDNNARSCRLIEENLLKLGVEKGFHLHRMGSERFLRDQHKVFDRILADPPYAYALQEDFFLLCRQALKDGGVMIFEYRSNWNAGENLPFSCRKFKKFGETGVWIYE